MRSLTGAAMLPQTEKGRTCHTLEAMHTGRAIHNLPRTPDRGDIRSITPRGFAQAVFAANSPFPKRS